MRNFDVINSKNSTGNNENTAIRRIGIYSDSDFEPMHETANTVTAITNKETAIRTSSYLRKSEKTGAQSPEHKR